jgi:hypothetical protein
MFMTNTHTLSKDIIYQRVNLANSTTVTSAIFDRASGAIEPKIMVPIAATLQPHPTSLSLSRVEQSFLRTDRQNDREYSNYLLDFLTGILAGFADKFVIGKRTTILLSALLASFLSQSDVRSAYPIAKYGNSRRREWKDRLLIVDFIDFLNEERINCDSALELGELSKLISCFKIFILNDIISSMLTPIKIDLNHK